MSGSCRISFARRFALPSIASLLALAFSLLALPFHSLAAEKDDAERIVRELFAFWIECPSALPHFYQEKAGKESLPRVVCDYIAGMTDHFIIEQYEKYCGGRSLNTEGTGESQGKSRNSL